MENYENEIWKDIPQYENLYQVSSFGRVKSLYRWVHNKGVKGRFVKELILKQCSSGRYCTVGLNNKKLNIFNVHQLVARAFLNHNPKQSNMVVNHKDFNKRNNSVDNLEIITTRDNTNKKHIKHSSIYTGVHLATNSKKWTAAITYKKRRYALGNYDNEASASGAYEKALIQIKNNSFDTSQKPQVKRSNTTSRFVGVTFYKRNSKWNAKISINKKNINLGYFENEEDAAKAYLSKWEEIYIHKK